MAHASVEDASGQDEAQVAAAATAAAVVAPPAAAPVAPPPAAPATAGPMRWYNPSSGFVLRRMAQLVSDGSRPDKVFKDKDVNLVAKQLKEFTGEIVSPTQVYNHLRKWR